MCTEERKGGGGGVNWMWMGYLRWLIHDLHVFSLVNRRWVSCILRFDLSIVFNFAFLYPADHPSSAPAPALAYLSEIDGVPRISLPIFGFASYKFKLSLWTDNGQLVSSLLQAAEEWLTLRQVYHPDFRFFCRR